MNFHLISCAQKKIQESNADIQKPTIPDLAIKTGAERTDLYLDLLKGKNIAIVANPTSQ
jgi:hypothetical protein